MVYEYTSKKTGKKYKLYTREVKLKGGKVQTIYFFCSRKPKSGKATDKPKGYKVVESPRTGLPFLKKKNKGDEDYGPSAQRRENE